MGKTTVSSISFFSKKHIKCPVCEEEFYREDIKFGRGRLIAGDLTDELRRIYHPSTKYGEVFPLFYPITVCPECYYSAFQVDFNEIPRDSILSVKNNRNNRFESVGKIFKQLDFRQYRKLNEGIASYYLAMMCYDYFPNRLNPIIKQGLSSYRAAWLFIDLHRKYPDKNYDYIAKLFYRKAGFFYSLSIDYDEKGLESLTEVVNLGPDLDKNYGYDGVLYVNALLQYRYSKESDYEKRIRSLEYAKTSIARIFGMGKATKGKPEVLLFKAKKLHASIRSEIKRMQRIEDE